jgi:nesprin-1
MWNDFEEKKDECMNWLKDTDTRLHGVDLKPSVETKVEQLNELKNLQGEIKAKELEIDAISELALNLQRQVVTSKSSSGVSSSDLTIKYQQISHKIKVKLDIRTSNKNFSN